MNRAIYHILIFLLLFSSAKGQEVSITAEFDTSRIYIGDQITFKITIDQPAELNLSLPYFRDTLVKNIEILSGPLVDSSRQNGRTRIIESYLVTSFDSGIYEIPPVYAELKNENGLKRFFSEYSLLEVLRVNIAPSDTTEQIYDIIQPYRAPVTLGEILPWLLLVALVGVLIWIASIYMRKFKKLPVEIETVIATDPAHIIAFRELEKLKEEQLWQKGEIKFYYSRLTEILRQYLENRFGIFSLELTTSETLADLVKAGFKKDESYNQLRSVLTGADLVKFAKYKPESEENEYHFRNSWDFVEVTKIEVMEPVAAVTEKGKGVTP